MVNCNRCNKQIEDSYFAETCWYCTAYLCFDCWDEYGHCGHKEADQINEQARKVAQDNIDEGRY